MGLRRFVPAFRTPSVSRTSFVRSVVGRGGQAARNLLFLFAQFVEATQTTLAATRTPVSLLLFDRQRCFLIRSFIASQLFIGELYHEHGFGGFYSREAQTFLTI